MSLWLPGPNLDDIIFEDPSQQASRPIKSFRRVVPPERKEDQAGIAKSKEQDPTPILQNRERDHLDLHSIDAIGSPGEN
jgi:hypothetical protein